MSTKAAPTARGRHLSSYPDPRREAIARRKPLQRVPTATKLSDGIDDYGPGSNRLKPSRGNPNTVEDNNGDNEKDDNNDDNDDNDDDDDDDSDGSDDSDDEVNDIGEAHYLITQRIRTYGKKNPEPTNIELDRFCKDHERNLISQKARSKTMLHSLLGGTCQPWLRLVIVKLLLNESPSLLSVRDPDGNTPVHLAISRKEKRDEVLEFFLVKYPDQCRKILNQSARRGKDECLHAAIKQDLDRCAMMMIDLSSAALCLQDRQRNTPLHLAVDITTDSKNAEGRKKTVLRLSSAESLKTRTKLIRKLIDHAPQKGVEPPAARLNKENLTPYQFYENKLQKLPPEDLKRVSEGLLEKETIPFILMEACMRLPTPHDTKLALYGNKPGPQIHFDLRDLSQRKQSLPSDFLKHLEGHLSLEKLLRYVYLPQSVTRNCDTGATSKTHSRANGNANSVVRIFDWLRKRGVRKIFRVIVRCDEAAPHSDDLIIASLKDFDVEFLDWEKLDLCSKTVHEAAPNVSELVLHASGNRAVLRSWSAQDGLIDLLKLKRVEIHFRQGSESDGTMKRNENEFHARMARHTRKIDFQVPRQGITRSSSFFQTSMLPESGVTGQDRQDAGSWVDSIAGFNIFLENVIPDSVSEKAPSIKVAILDDGVDMFESQLGGVAKGISFCTSRDQKMGPIESPYFTSSTGHGTVMASLVTQTFPRVTLCIAKLNHGTDPKSNRSCPTAESAAQAIQWARNEKVHIISMSWSIPRTEANESHIIELEAQISAAHKENILMFCAATDEGLDISHDRQFPAACKDKVFCIGGAEDSGRTDSSVGEQPVHFTAPGKAVFGLTQHRPSRAAENNAVTVMGSSVATALTAGLSALVLYCVGISKIKHFEIARRHQGMEMILQSLARSASGANMNSTYIRAREHFELEIEHYDWELDGKDALKKLVKSLIGTFPRL